MENSPGTSLEWVIENKSLLEQYSSRRDIFPSPAGVYIIEIKSLPDEARNVPGQFTIDPALTVSNELLITYVISGVQEAQLSRDNLYPRSLRLWLDGRRSLLENVDYSIDYSSGLITFLKLIPSEFSIYADYRYKLVEQGPYPYRYENTEYRAIPGAILAFGDRVQQSDKLAVVVGETRSDVADVYGGKFEVSFDVIAFSRDPDDRERLSDYIVMKMLERQNALGFEGLELLDVSPGGESEEIYVAEIDDYYYDGNISINMRVDWEIQSPLPIEIFRSEMTSKQQEQERGYMDGTYTADLLNVAASKGELIGIPVKIGGDLGFERIR
jgi:hypothetical protein